eukprot:6465036-Alexandrium_andersonii.AAC.1
MWPAHRRVVVAVEGGEGRSDPSSGEEQPDWGGGSDDSGDEEVFLSGPSRVVKMEVDEEGACGQGAE